MIRVSAVHPGTVADELGLQAGTELITINGRPLEDFLDWEFLTAEDELAIEARENALLIEGRKKDVETGSTYLYRSLPRHRRAVLQASVPTRRPRQGDRRRSRELLVTTWSANCPKR